MRALPATAVAGALLIVSASQWPGASAMGRSQAPSNCAAIGTPRPSASYTYELVESTGNRSQYTNLWEEVTAAGSRVRTIRASGTLIQVNEHHIVDDVVVLDRSTKKTADGGVVDSTVFRPGIVGDPAFRACEGRSWPIAPVTATYASSRNSASSATPSGTLRIVAIREVLTVPAGRFDTVHYIRTSQSTDEYWKSVEHGVVVKHIATLPGAVVSETLIAIK